MAAVLFIQNKLGYMRGDDSDDRDNQEKGDMSRQGRFQKDEQGKGKKGCECPRSNREIPMNQSVAICFKTALICYSLMILYE
jgi:hypothetical protein